jgi:hypothetical protein
MKYVLKSLMALALFHTMTSASFAASILPDGSDFGLPIAGVTFSGNGISSSNIAQTTFNGVTLGLSATPRYSSPALSNDGAGTFFAQTGAFVSEPGHSANPLDPYAKWNFNFFIGSAASSSYSYLLYYDFDPTAGNDISTHGIFTLPPGQNSWNLGMDFLASSLNPGRPPGFNLSTFDPNAVGEYSFKLAAYTASGLNPYANEVFSTSMVVSAIPEPGEWAMMLSGLAVVGLMARRRRQSKQ